MNSVISEISIPVRRKLWTIMVCVCSLSLQLSAQSSDEQQVKDVLSQLFQGMELGDSAMVRKCFVTQPSMATVRSNKEGQVILSRDGSLNGFLKAIGTPHAEKWYEEVWNVRVAIDGQMAQVWCDYAFYVGNKFSHCGVDALHLFKEGSQWKIFQLADTRRSTGCDIPAEIVRKHAP